MQHLQVYEVSSSVTQKVSFITLAPGRGGVVVSRPLTMELASLSLQVGVLPKLAGSSLVKVPCRTIEGLDVGVDLVAEAALAWPPDLKSML